METKSIPNTYPLSPLQEGMLFHTLSRPNSGVDIEQIICKLNEPLQLPLLNTAWQRVVDRQGFDVVDIETGGRDSPVLQCVY